LKSRKKSRRKSFLRMWLYFRHKEQIVVDHEGAGRWVCLLKLLSNRRFESLIGNKGLRPVNATYLTSDPLPEPARGFWKRRGWISP